MILIDTHVWVWWVHEDPRFDATLRAILERDDNSEIGVSVVSCWEVAKLVSLGRVRIRRSIDDWLKGALSYRRVRLIDLTVDIAIESTRLPGEFHKNPADQMLVATARVLNCPFVTRDSLILSYGHVQTLT